MTNSGEQPIWASRAELKNLGAEWAEVHYRGRNRGLGEPSSIGNREHDRACARRWEELTGKPPAWAKGGAA